MCHNISTIMIVTVTACTGGHFETTVHSSNIKRVLLVLTIHVSLQAYLHHLYSDCTPHACALLIGRHSTDVIKITCQLTAPRIPRMAPQRTILTEPHSATYSLSNSSNNRRVVSSSTNKLRINSHGSIN